MEAQLKALNAQFFKWIEQEVTREQTGILIEACEDYITQCQALLRSKPPALKPGLDGSENKTRKRQADGPAGLDTGTGMGTGILSPPLFGVAAPPVKSSSSFGLLSNNSSASSPTSFSFGSSSATQSGGMPSFTAHTTAAPSTAPLLFDAPASSSSPIFGTAPSQPASGLSSMFGAPLQSWTSSQSASLTPSLFGTPQIGVQFSSSIFGNGKQSFAQIESSSAVAHATIPTEDADEEDGPKEVAGEVIIDGSAELLFKAVASVSVQKEGKWQSKGQGTLTLRRDTTKGLDSASSFLVFTTEAGRILVRANLLQKSEAKQTPRPESKIMSLHFEDKFQTTLIRFKSSKEGEAFANHVAQHRPKQ